MLKGFAKGRALARLAKVDRTPIIRVDRSNEGAWLEVKQLVEKPTAEHGLVAAVTFVDDEALSAVSIDELRKAVLPSDHAVFFIADTGTMTGAERALLCVSLVEEGQQFRTLPNQVVWIESNLSIANMDFEDFSGGVDDDGVYRGVEGLS